MYNSFNKFIDDDIRTFLKENDNTFYEKITKDQVIKYMFEFENIVLRPPMMEGSDRLMFPSDARNGNFTYASRLEARVTQIQEIRDIYTKEIISRKVIGEPEDRVPIANIPILVRSKYCSTNLKKNFDNTECEYDPGCYFIVNGYEKVVISQERMIDNKPLVFKKKGPGTVSHYVQVNSRSPKVNGIMQIIRIQLNNNGSLTLMVPILNEFPIVVLFRALGIKSDSDIIDYIVPDKKDQDMLDMVKKAIRITVDDKGAPIQDQNDAINYLTTKIRVPSKYKYSETDKDVRQKQKRKYLESLLVNNFLPHITGGSSAKVYYLGYMINKLLNCALGRHKPDDRDSYTNKRVDLVGPLLDMLFRQFFKKMINECNKYWKKRTNNNDEKPFNIINQIRPNTIEQGLKAALSTGAWGGGKKGVAQVLQRLTYLQAIEFYRRIDSPSNDASSSKLTHPRQVHPTQNGMLCPAETPEHAKVGLVKHLTILGSVTVATQSQVPLIKKLLDKRVTKLSDVHPTQVGTYTRVFINGDFYGVCDKPIILYTELKNAKYNNSIEATVGIIYDDMANEIRVYSDGGRLFRPVIRVMDNMPMLTKNHIAMISPNKTKSETMITSWDEFMQRFPGVVEYIDAEEQCFSMLASNVDDVYAMRKQMFTSADIAKTRKEVSITNRYGDMTFLKYSHCDFHPSLLLGLIVTNIPFSNHNQGPRNIFQYAQGRQAMCIYISNYRFRMDTSFILYHPHRPLVNTRTSKYMYNDILSPGENAVVAIASYTG
jgi:DNA-directed RNA polymerase II subunit RPB2